jgi:hypothetical protein
MIINDAPVSIGKEAATTCLMVLPMHQPEEINEECEKDSKRSIKQHMSFPNTR